MFAIGFVLRRSRPACAVPALRLRRAVAAGAAAWTVLGGAGLSATPLSNVGLSSVRAQRFENEDLPPWVSQQDDLFGLALAAGDFNGDGADDLATGIPRDNCMAGTGPTDCGSVVIRYGIQAAGLANGLAAQILNQQEVGSPNVAEVGDFFGWALAACDLDGDGFDDLAVGVPKEDLTLGGTVDIEDSGIVEIYFGSSEGLVQPASTVLSGNGFGAAQQLFGFALACGDFNLDASDDLVVGVPGAVVNDLAGAGKIRVYPGSPTGFGAGSITIHQDSAGIEGVAEAGDRFGESLAVGDFDIFVSFYPDLAIGAPGENQGAGAVHCIRGSFGGLDTTHNFVFDQFAFSFTPENGDGFGQALATGDFDGDFNDDLAIGAPGEDVGDVQDTGFVVVAYGPFTWALPFAHVQGFDQDAVLGAGNTEIDDAFGFVLASGDFDRDGSDDLAIGHPLEDNVGASDGDRDGSVTVVMGSPGTGLAPTRHRYLAAAFQGTPGDLAEHDEFFGEGLEVGDFDGDGYDDLVIGVPHDEQDGLFNVGSEVVLYGSLFADGFESGGFIDWSSFSPEQ